MSNLDLTKIQMEQEILYWRAFAAYLASCHAASLESLPKSASASSRRRLKNICLKGAALLEGKEKLHQSCSPGGFAKDIERAIDRCKEAATTP